MLDATVDGINVHGAGMWVTQFDSSGTGTPMMRISEGADDVRFADFFLKYTVSDSANVALHLSTSATTILRPRLDRIMIEGRLSSGIGLKVDGVYGGYAFGCFIYGSSVNVSYSASAPDECNEFTLSHSRIFNSPTNVAVLGASQLRFQNTMFESSSTLNFDVDGDCTIFASNCRFEPSAGEQLDFAAAFAGSAFFDECLFFTPASDIINAGTGGVYLTNSTVATTTVNSTSTGEILVNDCSYTGTPSGRTVVRNSTKFQGYAASATDNFTVSGFTVYKFSGATDANLLYIDRSGETEGAVYIGTTSSGSAKFRVHRSTAGTSGNIFGCVFSYTCAPTSGASTATHEIVRHDGSTTGATQTINFIGCEGFYLDHSSAVTLANQRGFTFRLRNTSTGTVTEMVGAELALHNTNAGGTITSAYGYDFQAPTNAGTWSAVTYIRFQEPEATITTRRAIRQEGAGVHSQWEGSHIIGSIATTPETGIDNRGQATLRHDVDTAGIPCLLDNRDTTAAAVHTNSLKWRFARTGSATAIDAGRIRVDKEAEWTSTAATQDSQMVFATALNGTLTDYVTLDSAGKLSINASNAATSPIEELFQASTGDAATRWTLSGAVSYIAGIDNSDSDKYKISYGATGNAALGTNDFLTISTAGIVNAPISLNVGTATDGTSTVGNAAFGVSGGNRIHLDVDSGSSDFRMYLPAASNSGPRFLPRKDRSGGAASVGDVMFDFLPLMVNTTPAEKQGALMRFSVDSPTAGAEYGKLEIYVTNNSVTTTSFMIMNSVGVTIDNGAVGLPLNVKSWYNGGTVTDATGVGDWATGLTGAARIFYDQSDGDLENIFGASTVFMVPGVMFTATADAACSNTVTETSIAGTGVGTKTIPANYLRAGRAFRVTVRGKYSYDNGTLRIKLKLGSTVVLDTGTKTPSATPITDDQFEVSTSFTCRTTGGTGTIQANGMFIFVQDTAGDQDLIWQMGNTTTTTIDTTATQAIDVTAQWSAAAAGNTITGLQVEIEALY